MLSRNIYFQNFKKRINNNYITEFQEAKSQVIKIALFRLNEIKGKYFL